MVGLRSRRRRRSPSASGSASPGSAIPAAPAPIAAAAARTCATRPGFTGYTLDGGYAELAVADAAYCFPLPDGYDDAHAAPLLCAGLIGWRTLRMAGDARRLGIYGFGAAAHIVAQVARHEGRELFAFTRPGDTAAQDFARTMGAAWAGDAGAPPPAELDAALIFAPVGSLVPTALAAVRKGGSVVCGGIHMSDIPSFPYRLLWEERVVRSVANLTRQDAIEFLDLAGQVPIRTEVTPYPLVRGQSRRSPICARAGCRARRCWCHSPAATPRRVQPPPRSGSMPILTTD